MGMLDGLLGGIGQGLRAGSGVLNEQVFQNNEQLRQQQIQNAETRKAQMFKYVWEGIQSGSVDPQKGMQALAQIDGPATQQLIQALGQGAIQSSLEARQLVAKQQRDLQEQGANDAFAQGLGLQAGISPTVAGKVYATKNRPGSAPVRVVSGDTPEGQAIGIPSGERARVELDARGKPTRVLGRFGSQQSININMQPVERAWGSESGKTDSEFRKADMMAGQAAMDAEPALMQMGGLLKSGTSTGTLQPLITQLQGIADDAGIDISAISKRLGIGMGALANKEQFNSLAANLVITISSKFKGALNRKELQVLKDSQAGLGKSEKGNRLALASALAAARIAQERGAESAQTDNHVTYRKIFAERSRGGSEKFEAYRKEFYEQLGDAPQSAAGFKKGPPPPAGVSPDVWSAMTPEERALWRK
mgnify:CR=1 FL=1